MLIRGMCDRYVVPCQQRLSAVLCAAQNETSVDIICRRLSCLFMRESRIQQIRLAQLLTQDVATVYER
jgi:hypothetical protein